MLKWDYCPYIHSDELRKAFVKAQDPQIKLDDLLKEINEDPEVIIFLKKCLRFAPEPPTIAELQNVQFEIERKKTKDSSVTANQAATFRRKQKKKLEEIKE